MSQDKLKVNSVVIYGEDNHTVLPDFIHIKYHKDISEFGGRIEPHLHSKLFQIAVLEHGGVQFEAYDIVHKFEHAGLIVIPEDHVHAYQAFGAPSGWSLTISQMLVDEIIADFAYAESVFSSIRFVDELEANPNFERIKWICEQLSEEMSPSGVGSLPYKKSLIKLILINISRILNERNPTIVESNSREYKYLHMFKQELKESVDASRKIKDYAFAVGITPTHLNRICTALTSKTASKILHDTIVFEAKKYLRHSNFSISEIAFLLKFHDPSHFSKFFKNQTGQSPKQFRKDSEAQSVSSVSA